MKYQISIITPVYNAEPYLPAMMDSLRDQTFGFENLEVLLVDDHSTDGSLALLRQWEQLYPNVRVLQTERNSGGAATPRNTALPHASAPYVMFIDNDDTFAPDACRVLYEAAEKTGADLVSGYFRDVEMDGTPINEKNPSCGQTGDRMYALPQELEDAMRVNSVFWCKIYRTELIRRCGLAFPDDTLMEDTIFFTRYLLQCSSLYYTDQLIYNFHNRGDSLSHTPNANYVRMRARGYDYLFDLYEPYPACLEFNLRNVAPHFIPLIFSSERITPDERLPLLQAWRRVVQYTVAHDLCNPERALNLLFDAICREDWPLALELGSVVTELRRHVETIRSLSLRLEATDRNWRAAEAQARQAVCEKQAALQQSAEAQQQAALAAQTLEAVRASRAYRLAHKLAGILHRD